jgi:para-nitrobenzyl esterase
VSELVTVRAPRGGVRGRRERGSLVFRGIPYATADRFAPPRQASWDGAKDALANGPAAPQPDRPAARFTHGPLPLTDEQRCLNLNVFTPSLDGRRPVMVWIHGGGFAIGSAGASIYDGSRLADAADAVVIAANYRLGSPGWLYHPDLASGSGTPAGNWGLLDQIEALRWVSDNVAAFGGDPDRVTVAGQSAGALAALGMLSAPAAAGLFHRVIAQSPPLSDAAAPGEASMRWAGALSHAIAGGTEFAPDALRSAPVADLLAAHEALLTHPEFRGTRGAIPTADPGTLPRSIAEHPELTPGVPVMIGSTAQEGTFFFGSPWRPAPPPERVLGVVAHLVPDRDPADVLDEYARAVADSHGPALDAATLLVAVATDAMFTRPVSQWARARAQSAAAGVHLYRVDHAGAGPVLGATHTADVPLLFGTWDDGDAGERLGGQAAGAEAVAAEMVAAWRGFLHTGEPGWDPVGARDESSPFVFGTGDSVTLPAAIT